MLVYSVQSFIKHPVSVKIETQKCAMKRYVRNKKI